MKSGKSGKNIESIKEMNVKIVLAPLEMVGIRFIDVKFFSQ
jgi:hypothetical protein